MRWPWQRREVRESGGTTYTQLVSRLIAAQADGQIAPANETAAVEAVAGLLARSFRPPRYRGRHGCKRP